MKKNLNKPFRFIKEEVYLIQLCTNAWMLHLSFIYIEFLLTIPLRGQVYNSAFYICLYIYIYIYSQIKFGVILSNIIILNIF